MKTKINLENIESLIFNIKEFKIFTINSFLLIILSFFSLACQKSIDDINDSSVEKNKINAQKTTNASPEKMLSFTTLDEYESFFNNPDFANSKIETTDYSPLRNTIDEINNLIDSEDPDIDSNPIMEDAIYDDYGLLLDILNQKKLVRLGDYIVRVDLANNKIFTISSSIPHAVDIILTDTTNISVVEHDPEVELISFIFKIFSCKERFAAKKKSEDNYEVCSSDSKKRIKRELTYQSAGIYFSIVGEIKTQRKNWLGLWVSDNNAFPDISYFSYTLKQRCGNNEAWGGDPDSWGNSLAWSKNGHKATFRPYQSTRALTTFNVYATMESCGSITRHIED